MTRRIMVLCLSGASPRGVAADVRGAGRVRLVASACVPRSPAPGTDAEVSPTEGAAVVGALIEALGPAASAHRNAPGVVLVVARHAHILRPFEVPGARVRTHDLVGVARVRLGGDSEAAVVDAAPALAVPGPEPRTLGVGAALPEARAAWARACADAAGVRLLGLVPASEGIAALAPDPAVATLVVHAGPGVVRTALALGGRALVAREWARQAGLGGDDAAVVDEACRTLASAAALGIGIDAPKVAVCAGDVSPAVRARLAEETGLETHAGAGVGAGAFPAWLEDARPGQSHGAKTEDVLDLLGVARAHAARERLDFARPTRVPDRAARARQFGLAAVLVLAAWVVGVKIAGDLRLRALQRDADAARAQLAEAAGELVESIAEAARVEHAERYARANPDWIAHLARVAGALPAPDRGLLGSFSGSADAEVIFTKGRESLWPGRWSARPSVSLRVAGSVVESAEALALRQRLLGDRAYRVASRGPDVPSAFDLELGSVLTDPAAADQGARATP
jgi:hypothetical protein